jgi:hypothetical protein
MTLLEDQVSRRVRIECITVREDLTFTLGHLAVDTIFTVAGNSIVPLSAVI